MIHLIENNYIAYFSYNCVNVYKKFEKNNFGNDCKKIGELLLSDEFDYASAENLVSMANTCIKFCTNGEEKFKFSNPKIIR